MAFLDSFSRRKTPTSTSTLGTTMSFSGLSKTFSGGDTRSVNYSESKAGEIPTGHFAEIIFVRHGFSCANHQKERKGILSPHALHSDPELTRIGILESREIGEALCNYVKTLDGWTVKNQKGELVPNFILGSSSLIRAQETAFYMVGEKTGSVVYVMPHIAEAGSTRDNTPKSEAEQRTFLGTSNENTIERNADPGIGTHINQDFRYSSDSKSDELAPKTSWSEFTRWFIRTQQLTDIKTGINTGLRKAIIVTHSHFLKNLFIDKNVMTYKLFDSLKHKVGTSLILPNNGAIRLRMSLSNARNLNHQILDFELVPGTFLGTVSRFKIMTPKGCPDGCGWTSCTKSENAEGKNLIDAHYEMTAVTVVRKTKPKSDDIPPVEEKLHAEASRPKTAIPVFRENLVGKARTASPLRHYPSKRSPSRKPKVMSPSVKTPVGMSRPTTTSSRIHSSPEKTGPSRKTEIKRVSRARSV